MSRLQGGAFAALVIATVAAFFVTQHLKIQTPLIQGSPAPQPAAFDPLNGVSGPGEPKACYAHPPGKPAIPIDYRQVETTFYLQHQPDHVAVYIVDTADNVVRTITSNYDFRRTFVRNPPSAFAWNGIEDDGRYAPAGTYYYRVAFQNQDRTIEIPDPITLTLTPPRPRVVKVTPALISPSPTAPATITYTGTSGLGGYIDVIRTDLPGGPRQVFSFRFSGRRHTAVWNGEIRGAPAPPGTYLIGMRVLDRACHVGTFPPEDPPVPGTTPHAGVTVRYLAAQVPSTAVPAGADASVFVDARKHAYVWKLFRPGFTRVLARGSAAAGAFALRVPLPATGPGLYGLSLSYPGQHTLVPLVASPPADASPRTVLVVLPALTWQAVNPVDDHGDGLPDTLAGGGPVQLARPLVAGLPADFADEAALLSALNRAGFNYDLTTDLSLAADPGLLSRHRGVVFAGPETWVPASLVGPLKAFVQAGGNVLALGTGSLRRTVTVRGGVASDPTDPAPTDLFGARRGQIVTGNHSIAFKFSDPLGLFSTGSGAFSGITNFQPIQPPAGSTASTAGISAILPAIAGFRVGSGAVVEVGVDDFGLRLARDPDYRALLARTWRLLGS